MKMKFLCFLAFVFLLLSYKPERAKLPAGFTEKQLASNLNPTTMTLAPDGRLFLAMKDGRVLLVKDDVLQETPYLTVAVNDFNECGLSGIALHPNFETNQLIYLYYSVRGRNYNRISSFQGNGNFAIPSSEKILLETNPRAAPIHNAGAMEFGLDGKLYISVGDCARPNDAQNMNSLLGKFLRINDDGSIPEDNPFFNSASGKYRAIWALGFRNPFTFDIDTSTGKILSTDTGGARYEEVNEVLPGKNYGWPIIEGPRGNRTPPANYKDPLYSYPHIAPNNAITGGVFYNPKITTFPARYHGKFFFMDYVNSFVKVLDPNNGSIIETFATEINRPLNMLVSPLGHMYYYERRGIGNGSQTDNTGSNQGKLWKITYTGDGSPNITRQPEPLLVVVGEQGEFSIGFSGNEPLSFQWQKNGVNIFGATQKNYKIPPALLTDNGSDFRCVITNNLGTIISKPAILSVTSNTRPLPKISQPASGELYQGGDIITYKGSAFDSEDGTLGNSQLTWWIDFHHDDHTHPVLAQVSGNDQGTFSIPRVGELSHNVWYRIYLKATDSKGLTKVVFKDVFPRKSQFTLNTTPPGLNININGTPTQTPVTITGVVGSTRTLKAPLLQETATSNIFKNWSNGSTEETFDFNVTEESITLTANYKSSELIEGDGLLGMYWSNQDQVFEGDPSFQRVDKKIDFNWGNGSPNNLISNDYFTARWTGYIKPLFTEKYTFYTNSDDGVRLKIDNKLIINEWRAMNSSEKSESIDLKAGTIYPILLEYFEKTGAAKIQLFWESTRTVREIIPSSQLISPNNLALDIDDKFQDLNNLKIFPVPADKELWIEYKTTSLSPIFISIYNLLGQEVWRSEIKPKQELLKLNVDVKEFPPGIYISKLVSKEGTTVCSFVKN